MSPARPHIPAAIKRQVRRECAFGCVVCGLPFFEYDHIEPYCSRAAHEAYNIALLCPEHHAKKTGGLLPAKRVWEARRNPFNRDRSLSSGDRLFYGGRSCTVKMGNSTFSFSAGARKRHFAPVVIDREPFILFELVDGDLLLSMVAFDENGTELLNIRRNELRVSPASWDYNREGRRLILRTGKGNVLLDLIFEAPQTLIVRRARILRNGVEIDVLREANVVLNNSTILTHISVRDFTYGFVIGGHMPDGTTAIEISPVPREPFDRASAIRSALKQLLGRQPSHHYVALDAELGFTSDIQPNR